MEELKGLSWESLSFMEICQGGAGRILKKQSETSAGTSLKHSVVTAESP